MNKCITNKWLSDNWPVDIHEGQMKKDDLLQKKTGLRLTEFKKYEIK